jgi:histidinol phosphatase-like enzyme (inositol monophosphatase family)
MTDPRSRIAGADVARFRDHALALADESRRQLRAFFAGSFEVKHKPDGSPVTSADIAVEERLREMIARQFPDHGIVGEEHGAQKPEAEFQWILDPVDGTEDFVHRVPTFGTIIALHYRGAPVVGVIDVPMLDARVHAAFGLGAFRGAERLRLADLDPATPPDAIRITLSARTNFTRHRDDGALFEAVTRSFPNHRIYRSCFAHLCAATGQADAAIDVGNPIWDFAAARILVEEAGGAFRVVQDYAVGPDRFFTTIFGRPRVVERLAALFAGA